MKPKYITELFDHKMHLLKDFNCGINELDIYIKEKAGQEMRKKVSAVYILREKSSFKIIGYYTLSSFSVELIELSLSIRKKLPKHKALPVILLGRLAVDSTYQGEGVGKNLLIDALSRAYGLSKQIGAFAVIVDAKDDKIRIFYEKYGFIRALHSSFMHYLPMQTIKQLFD